MRRLKPAVLALLVARDLSSVAIEAVDLAAGWRGACLELGALAGWPRLAYRKPSSVAPGEHAWRLFITRHSVQDLMLVADATRAYLARLPMPLTCPRYSYHLES
ncbi:MAG: hypothetical protein O2919_06855 [Chloroflexi bacterium]|nr:hypothetical protein [Chloroflexota bacterium]